MPNKSAPKYTDEDVRLLLIQIQVAVKNAMDQWAKEAVQYPEGTREYFFGLGMAGAAKGLADGLQIGIDYFKDNIDERKAADLQVMFDAIRGSSRSQ